MQSEDQYLKRMKRNDGKERNLLYMTRMKSLDNKKVPIFLNIEIIGLQS